MFFLITRLWLLCERKFKQLSTVSVHEKQSLLFFIFATSADTIRPVAPAVLLFLNNTSSIFLGKGDFFTFTRFWVGAFLVLSRLGYFNDSRILGLRIFCLGKLCLFELDFLVATVLFSLSPITRWAISPPALTSLSISTPMFRHSLFVHKNNLSDIRSSPFSWHK